MHRLSQLLKGGLISWSLVVSACSPLFPSHKPIPDNARTMEQIYNEHQSRQSTRWNISHPIPDGISHLDGYAREVYDELSVRFPRLPNPTIIMYVFPHLSLESSPVPGYSTMFQLYEKVEYALPGELFYE